MLAMYSSVPSVCASMRPDRTLHNLRTDRKRSATNDGSEYAKARCWNDMLHWVKRAMRCDGHNVGCQYAKNRVSFDENDASNAAERTTADGCEQIVADGGWFGRRSGRHGKTLPSIVRLGAARN